MSFPTKHRPCPCGKGIDTDGDGNCNKCAPRCALALKPLVCPKCGSGVFVEHRGLVYFECDTLLDQYKRYFHTRICDILVTVYKRFATEKRKYEDCIENAWTLIANVSSGDWNKQDIEWKQAATDWRDNSMHSIMLEITKRKANETKSKS